MVSVYLLYFYYFLSDTNLNDKGIKLLGKMIQKNDHKMEELILSCKKYIFLILKGNLITNDGFKDFFRILRSNETLKRLEIGGEVKP